MISLAYYARFIELGVSPERFVKMAQVMGMPAADKPEDFLAALAKLQRDCGVADLKMSDWGISRDEFPAMVRNAREAMGMLFACDPAPLSEADCLAIYEKSFR